MARRRAATSPAARGRFRKRLVFMAKAPVLGTVKSRLAREIGWVKATAFHRHSVHRLVRRLACRGRWASYLAVTPDARRATAFPALAGPTRLAQGPGDLGARMHRVMMVLPPGPVLIVGTDIPQMRPADLAHAFRLLGDNAAVLGPGSDGGYWLVGLRRTPRTPAIFRNVRWSSADTLRDTLANIASGEAALGATLDDVDDAATYRRLQASGSRLVLPPRAKPAPPDGQRSS